MYRFTISSLAILIIFAAFVNAAPIALVDYFGPSGTLGGYSDDGVVQNYVIGGMTQKYQSIAVPVWVWTDEDVYLTSIEAGFERLGYDGALKIRVVSDSGGVPGSTVLEELTTTITSKAVYTFEASGTTRLTSESKYWIVAIADYPSRFGWYQPAEGSGCSDYLINTGSGWNAGPWSGNLALRVNAVQVPEPATMLLLTLGGIFLRKKK